MLHCIKHCDFGYTFIINNNTTISKTICIYHYGIGMVLFSTNTQSISFNYITSPFIT